LREKRNVRLSLESNPTGNRIRAYAKGEIGIGDAVYRRSLAVSAERLIPDWGPEAFEDLTDEHLAMIVEFTPEVVILGCGETQRFPSPSVTAPLTSRGIGVEIMETGAACRTFNILLAEDRRVVAALIV
jgi:uncharacterized protein